VITPCQNNKTISPESSAYVVERGCVFALDGSERIGANTATSACCENLGRTRSYAGASDGESDPQVGMVACRKIRDVHLLWPFQPACAAGMGDGERSHPGCRVPEAGSAIRSPAGYCPGIGQAGPASRDEIHGDDDQASRGLLQLRYETDRLECRQCRCSGSACPHSQFISRSLAYWQREDLLQL
jgi:hypothetical protein